MPPPPPRTVSYHTMPLNCASLKAKSLKKHYLGGWVKGEYKGRGGPPGVGREHAWYSGDQQASSVILCKAHASLAYQTGGS